ncbi:MAG: toll/interleukin-1 receptor domain-containing protein [Candidatus Rokubacteria bacterium]|nr:toll/interleukin-1 receptor domain-containing protein [Candidatus Rokubacteria bacterium]
MKTFISHAQKDHGLVHALAGALHEAGIEPVVAARRLMPGTRLDEKVQRLIEEADCVVVLGTPAAATSRWVQQEIGCAKALGRYIVPLKTRGTRLAAMLEGLEYYVFSRKDIASDFSRVASVLRQWAIDRKIKISPETDSPEIDNVFQILHLPHPLLCRKCKHVDNHVAVCLLCGEWLCECGAIIQPDSRALPEARSRRGRIHK